MLTIYKASAGSGKTYTLTLEYVKLLLGVKLTDGSGRYVLNADRYVAGGHRLPNRHRAILAITFTNAATDEMKTRIVRDLAALAGSGDSKYRGTLTAEYGCTADELRESARLALAEMLYDYDSFNVSTIDSFFQTVLRSFSREVDHQGNYELSLNHNDVVAQAISLMLDDINYGNADDLKNIRRWIRNYIFNTVDSGKAFNFFNRSGGTMRSLAKSVADALVSEVYTANADEFRRYMADPARLEAFRRKLGEASDEAVAGLRKAVTDFVSFTQTHGIPETAFSSYLRSRVAATAADPASIADANLSAGYMRNLASDSPDINAFYTKGYRDKGLGAVQEEAFGLACRFGRQCVETAERCKIYGSVSESLTLLEFISITADYMRRFLSETNTVLISDTGEILKKIISEEEMPFIYERLGMRLESLLIDEFQDTSHLQWHNLRPLVANSLASGRDCLIIGDEKQSIFRFRNSDSELLGHQVQECDFPPPMSRVKGGLPSENTNWRSAGDMVRFNNTLFSRIAALAESDSFGNVIQTPSKAYSGLPAYVRLQFLEGMEKIVADQDDDSGTASETDIFESMARTIIRQHEAGYKWSDIIILVKTHKDAVKTADFLMRVHPEIRMVSSEALVLNSSPAVRTIIGILKLVERSYKAPDEINRKAPEKKFANRQDITMMISRYSYLRGEGLDAADALEAALSGSDEGGFSDRIKDIRDENPANLVALIETIVEHKIPLEQRESEYAYIAALQDIALKHCEGSDCSLATFLADYDRNIEKWAIQTSAKLDGVEIMTMHKSKGLERACVHIPLANWNFRKKSETLWVLTEGLFSDFDSAIVPPMLRLTISKGCALESSRFSPVIGPLSRNVRDIEADNLNLTYVAFTRAKRELTVYSQATKSDIGRWLLDAVSAPDSDAELSDSSRISIAAHYDCDRMLFELGAPTVPEKAGSDVDKVPGADAGCYDVVRRDDVREITAVDDLLSDPDKEDEPDKEIADEADGSENAAEAARRGTDLHNILASVRTRADLPDAVARYALRCGLLQTEADSYLTELEAAFDRCNEQTDAWFAPGVEAYTERAVYNPEKDETLRPDRVIVGSEGDVAVIDYKFTSGVRDSHRRQVEVYTAMFRALGYKNVAGYLWYPLSGRIIKV